MLSAKSYDNYLKRVQLALKLPFGNSHGLRHSCANLYMTLGASDEGIQKLLGHKNLSSTKPYIHRTDSEAFEIAKKIS
jgi:integrase